MSTEKTKEAITAYVIENKGMDKEDVEKFLEESRLKYEQESMDILPREEKFSASVEETGFEKLHWVVIVLGTILISALVYTVLSFNSSMELNSWQHGATSICIGFFAFTGIYILWGLRIVGPTEEYVISRLGKYLRTATRGPRLLCLPGLIDYIENVVDLEEFRLQLYQDEEGNSTGDHELDFGNDSAEVMIEAQLRIHNSSRFTFTSTDALVQIENIIDSMLRPLLQSMGIDAVQVHKTRISQAVTKWVRDDLEKYYGIYLIRILITDIVLSEETKNIRRRRLIAETDAQEEIARGASIGIAIAALRDRLSEISGQKVSLKEARAVFEQRTGMATIEKTGANVSFVAPGVGGVLGTFDVGNKQQESNK